MTASSSGLPSPLVVRLCVDSPAHTRAALDALVGAPSDEGWDRGSVFAPGPGARPRQNTFGRWCLVERASLPEDGDAAIVRVLERARGLAAALAALGPGISVSLQLFVSPGSDVFGLGLGADQIAFLASIGASLEQSFVVARSGESDSSSD